MRERLFLSPGVKNLVNDIRVYYREAAAAFVVFDLTRRATFEAAVRWKEDLDMKVVTVDGSKVPAVLLANKSDLTDQRVVTDHEIEQMVKEAGFAGWHAVSAK